MCSKQCDNIDAIDIPIADIFFKKSTVIEG